MDGRENKGKPMIHAELPTAIANTDSNLNGFSLFHYRG